MLKNFIEELFSREIGGVSLHRSKDRPCIREHSMRQSRKMLRHIFVSKSSQREFCKIPTIVSNGQVYYDDGKLFLVHKATNSVDCHAVRDGGSVVEEKLAKTLCSIYSIPLKPKWKDQVKNNFLFLQLCTKTPSLVFCYIRSVYYTEILVMQICVKRVKKKICKSTFQAENILVNPHFCEKYCAHFFRYNF